MLRLFKALQKHETRGRDGALGHVRDIFFQDEHWEIRYFVVDVGGWMHRKEVLLSPVAVIKEPSGNPEEISFILSKDEIRCSPPVDTQKPVSRQHEADLYRYYGWTPYWSGFAPLDLGAMGAAIGLEGLLAAVPIAGKEPLSDSSPVADEAKGDPHLRSLRHTAHSIIEAVDGSVGHVTDALVDDTAWTLPYLVVNTSNWLPGRTVVVPTSRVSRISWAESTVNVSLTRAEIEASPHFDKGSLLDSARLTEVEHYYGASAHQS